MTLKILPLLFEYESRREIIDVDKRGHLLSKCVFTKMNQLALSCKCMCKGGGIRKNTKDFRLCTQFCAAMISFTVYRSGLGWGVP